MKLVTKLSDKAIALSCLEFNQVPFGIKLFEKGYMPKKEYCCEEGVLVVEFLENAFAVPDSDRIPKAQVTRFLELMESIFGYMTDSNARIERYITNKRHIALIEKMGYEKSYSIFKQLRDKQLKNNGEDEDGNLLDVHNFVSNLPKIHKDDNADDIYNIIMKVLKYNSGKAMEILQYINYQKVRNAKNVEEALKHILIVKGARNGISKSQECPAYSAMNAIKDTNAWCAFSKEATIVATVGSDTFCCFTKGGAAGRLLVPAMKSPISGVIHGQNPNRWFSFVWELVVKEDNMFWKCLVLDNVEARSVISTKHWNRISARLKGLEYRRIYCGTLRNDVKFPKFVTTMYPSGKEPKKPNKLTGYESSFGGSDDSAQLYTIHDRLLFTDKNIEQGKKEADSIAEFLKSDENADIMDYNIKDNPAPVITYNAPHSNVKKKMTVGVATHMFNQISLDVTLRRMNPGDLHRCKYIEKMVYPTPDPDFIKHNVLRSPSLIMESPHAIYGYLLTSIHWLPITVNLTRPATEWFKLAKESIPKVADRSKFVKVLYIDDLWCISYIKCIMAFKEAMPYIAEWCKLNGINIVVGSTNRFSEGLANKLQAFGLRFEENAEGAGEGVRFNTIKKYTPTSLTVDLVEPTDQWTVAINDPDAVKYEDDTIAKLVKDTNTTDQRMDQQRTVRYVPPDDEDDEDDDEDFEDDDYDEDDED